MKNKVNYSSLIFIVSLLFFSSAFIVQAATADLSVDAGAAGGDPGATLPITAATTTTTTTESTTTTPTSSGTTAGSQVVFFNPIGAGTVPALLSQVLGVLQGLIAVLAVIFIVAGGIMYMFAGVNQAAATKGKAMITAAVIGLVIALSANTFLIEIWNILRPVTGVTPPPAGQGLKEIAINVLQFLLSIVGVLGIIAMVIGGGMMLTAYGNPERATKGKIIATYAVIGIVISLSALIIVRQISNLILGY